MTAGPLDMPVLTTARLFVRPFEPADLDAVVALLDDGFGPASRDQRAAWLDWAVRNVAALSDLCQPPFGDRAVVRQRDGQRVGSFGRVPLLAGRTTDRFTPELGLFWAVAPAYRGHGYAAEAAAAVVDFAFGHLNAARVVAMAEHDNAASIAVMRRLGMTVWANPTAEPPWFQTVGVRANPAG